MSCRSSSPATPALPGLAASTEPCYETIDAPPPVQTDAPAASPLPPVQQWPAADMFPEVIHPPERALPGARCTASVLVDSDIVHGLAATPERQEQLMRAAQLSVVALMTPDRGNAECLPSETSGSMAPTPGLSAPDHAEDWPRNYVVSGSDVNVFVQGSVDSAIQNLQLSEVINGLELVERKAVQNLDLLQCTFSCGILEAKRVPEFRFGIILAGTDKEFVFLQGRQNAFRKVLRDQRVQMQANYGDAGMLTFDAYIYLLKAFAATVPQGALSSFQAMSLGLFVLQMGIYKPFLGAATQPTALVLFECFLRWCCVYFSSAWRTSSQRLKNYRFAALDLSTGRLGLRLHDDDRCEAYFMEAEVICLDTSVQDRLNVTRSISPKVVHEAAYLALMSHLSVANGELVYG